MLLNDIMQEKKISAYRLSKNSGIPYATVNDICNGKARLEKCSAETIYKISNALGVTMEAILAPCFVKRSSFEVFKSGICHRLKSLGDIDFIAEVLTSNDIRKYYRQKWHPEALYLLAMLDYVSKINGIPLCKDYDDLRSCRLSETIYPSSVRASAIVSGNNAVIEQAHRAAIPEFLRFNIIENEVRNVV